MPASHTDKNLFPDLGIGVGLRADYYSLFTEKPPSTVRWVEAISETYMNWQDREIARPIRVLEKVRAHLPVVLHGVSMSLGSTDPLNELYLGRLKELVDRIQPAWLSDHLCWTGVDGENLHDLLPLPYTEEALEHVADRVLRVQDFLGRRILVENVSSYVQFPESRMTEWEFLAELAARADCGILLDVNNVFVSAFNHGFDALDYLRAIPAERVGQIHLAGHTDRGDHLLDTHDAPIRAEVWDLYRWAARRFGGASAMIERDDNMPDWRELEMELRIAERIRKETHAEHAVGIASATL